MKNINIIRIESKLKEIFSEIIDLSDIKKMDEEQLKTFYSRALAALGVMKLTGIEAEFASRSVTDGYHDMGIDAIYCDDIQKQLILVQSKWRTEGNGAVSQEEMLSFTEGVKRIMSLDFEGANNKIIKKTPEITTAIRNMDYKVIALFIHTGSQELNVYAKRPIISLIENTNDEYSEILSFFEFKISDVFNYLATGQNEENINIDDVLISNWGIVDEPIKAYYGTISASAIGEWYSKFGNHLFAKNIRFYKGNTDVNDGMRKVLKEEPENFFYYNNGLKILCKKITRKAAMSTNNKVGLLSIEGISLVNGAQTTGTIGEIFKENPEQTDKACVQIQLIEIGDTDDSALKITKLTNTQNRIESKEFAALDHQQDRIKNELLFSGIVYLYKTGAVVEDLDHQISLDEAIVAQACFQEDVTYTATAKRNIGALTEDINKAPYKVLFNASTNSFTLKNNVQVLRLVEIYLLKHESDFQGKNRLALVHGNRLILHIVLQEIKNTEGYNEKIIQQELLSSEIFSMCQITIENVIEAMNSVFPDAYPAYIFKNAGRCRQILSKLSDL